MKCKEPKLYRRIVGSLPNSSTVASLYTREEDKKRAEELAKVCNCTLCQRRKE